MQILLSLCGITYHLWIFLLGLLLIKSVKNYKLTSGYQNINKAFEYVGYHILCYGIRLRSKILTVFNFWEK